MPLPKPPATRAALLSAADYESQSAPKTSRRSQKAAEPKQKMLDLHDDRAETAVAKAAPRPAAAPAARAPASSPGLPVKAPAAYPIAPAPAARPKATGGSARKRARAGGPPKLFVLDTDRRAHV